MVKLVASMFARLQSLGADAVQPYEPWALWQGRDYDCCDCNGSWGSVREVVTDGHHPPQAGGCVLPSPKCKVPPCYGH